MELIYFISVLVEVVERNSPPAPVEILPSNAGQDIGPTQSAGKTSSFLFLFLSSKNLKSVRKSCN